MNDPTRNSDYVEVKSLLQLLEILESNELSKGALSSKSNFTLDVQCKCGWSYKIDPIRLKRTLDCVKDHYAKPTFSDLNVAKKLRSFASEHSRYGWYFDQGKVVADNIVRKANKISSFFPSTKKNPPPISVEKTVTSIVNQLCDDASNILERSDHIWLQELEGDVILEECRSLCNEVVEEESEVELEAENIFLTEILDKEFLTEALNDICEEAISEVQDSVPGNFEEEAANFCDDKGLRVVPPWVNNILLALDMDLINAVQIQLLKDFARNIHHGPKGREYSTITKYYFKLLALSCSITQYNALTYFQPAPTLRALKELKCKVLSTTNISEQNFQEVCDFFEKLVSR